MKKVIFLLLVIVTLSSCAVHSGIVTGNASITNANFKITGLAVGQASTTQFLGIGGLKKDALVLEAKRNLYQNHPLTKGQALANVSVDFKRTLYPFIFKNQAIISAEIIDFNTDAETVIVDTNDKIFDKDSSEEWVMFIKKDIPYKAKILSKNKKKATILYEDKNGCYRIKRISDNKIYTNGE